MQIDTSGLSQELQDQLQPILILFQDTITGLENKLAEAEKSGDGEKVAALEAKVEELTAQLAKVKTAGDDPKPKDKNKPGQADDDADSPALEAIAALKAQLDEIKTERDQAKASASAQAIAEKVVAEKYPNAPAGQKKQLIARIAGSNPADEAAAITTSKAVITEWKEAGVDIKAIGADSAAEGKKPTPAPGSTEAHIEEMRSRKKSTAVV